MKSSSLYNYISKTMTTCSFLFSLYSINSMVWSLNQLSPFCLTLSGRRFCHLLIEVSGLGLGLWCFTPLSNISVISWRSVLLVEETGVPGENHRLVGSHWQTLSHNVVHLGLIEIRTHNISGDRHWLHR